MIMHRNIERSFNRDNPVTVSNCLYKTYLIGSMESPGKGDSGIGWRKDLTPLLNNRGIYPFDPTKEEVQKVGMSTKDLMKKLNGWQLSGNWDLFTSSMRCIWRGVTKIQEHPETHEAQMLHILGDIDYVESSDFLIWTLHDGDKLGGTIAEATIAWYRGIPIYLVTEVPKSTINKSLLYFVLDSGHGRGKIFKNYGELLSFLDGEYKLNVIGE
jgi:hypothetical protein